MANQIFLYTGTSLTLVWGIAHLFPTKSVVQNFGDISLDNKRIITMEWILEGILLIFIGSLCSCLTYLYYTDPVSIFVITFSAVFLFIIAIISIFTGFKVNFFPFRLCPFIFSVSAILLLMGVYA